MKKIAIVTATRAEYGLLKPLIDKINKEDDLEVRLVVTGMHLSPEFGMTFNEIVRDGITIDKKIEILLSSDTAVAISKSMGLAMISFSEYFEECQPDALIVLGDRFETLAICSAATNARIPIFHLYGGETTEGLIDEAYRHSITKMSYLHFASTETYRKRIIQMGENPNRVFNVGALGVENALNTTLMSLKDLEDSLGCDLKKDYAIGTFHPVTLEKNTSEQQIDNLIKAISRHPEIKFLFTKANADTYGRVINLRLLEYSRKHDNLVLVDSLGMKRYLSALKYATFVIGNSSSGLVEAPSFQIPTINIGDRQKGRIAGKTVIHCEPDADSIDGAIKEITEPSFRESIRNMPNPYGEGGTSDKIVQYIKYYMLNEKIDLKKKFYDIEFEVF